MVASALIPLATSGHLQQLTDSPNSSSLPTSSHCFSFKLLAGITLRNKKNLKKHYLSSRLSSKKAMRSSGPCRMLAAFPRTNAHYQVKQTSGMC
jgi:hypothetical protein